ncbi:MAG: hypothetical protein Tsb008_05410 [Rhodothalassiaceae bacterium]
MMPFTALRRAMGFASAIEDHGSGVSVGDRFYEHGNWDMVWVVERLLEPRGSEMPHAVISHSRVPSEKRLIALSTLCDPMRFARDLRGERSATPSSRTRRRRHDAPRDLSAADFGGA